MSCCEDQRTPRRNFRFLVPLRQASELLVNPLHILVDNSHILVDSQEHRRKIPAATGEFYARSSSCVWYDHCKPKFALHYMLHVETGYPVPLSPYPLVPLVPQSSLLPCSPFSQLPPPPPPPPPPTSSPVPLALRRVILDIKLLKYIHCLGSFFLQSEQLCLIVSSLQ